MIYDSYEYILKSTVSKKHIWTTRPTRKPK